jgi:PKD repeat protein
VVLFSECIIKVLSIKEDIVRMNRKMTNPGRVWPRGRALLAIVLLFSVAFTLGGPTLASGHHPIVSVVPAASMGYPGEELTVAVEIEEAEEVVGFQFNLDFNPAVVEITEWMEGDFLGDADVFQCDVEGDTLECQALNVPPYDGGAIGGVLVELALEVTGRGVSDLMLHDVQVATADGDTDDVENLNDGMVNAALAMAVEPSPETVNPGDTFTQMVKVYNAVDLAGYQFTLEFDPEVVQVEDVADASFLGSTGRSPFEAGKTVDNEAGMLTFAVASTGTADGPNGSDTLAEVTFNVVAEGAADTALDLSDLAVFDTAGTEATPADMDGMLHVVAAGVQIVPMETEKFEGETFTVDVMVGEAEDVAGYEFNMGFDPDVVEVRDVEIGSFLTDVVSDTKMIDNMAGTVNFAAFSLAGQDGTGTLATITLEAMPTDTEVTTDLDLFDVGLFDTTGAEVAPKLTDGMVTVKPCVPVAIDDLTSDSPVALGETMYFTATISGSDPIEYDWDFGGAGTLVGGGEETGAFVYDEPGTYTVNLTVDNPCGSDTETLEVQVCEPPTITSLNSSSPVVEGQAMDFTAMVDGTTPITYDWDFGGAGTATGEDTATPTFTYDEAGTYTVTLTAENCGGTAEGTLVVEVMPCEAVMIDSFTSDSPVTVGETMNFTATVSGSDPITYSWDFGGAGTLVGGGEETGAYRYDATGTYTVTLSVENDCGQDEETLMVTVEEHMIFVPITAKNFTP